MKKFSFFAIFLILIFATSCDAVDRAIEDTFREPVHRKTLADDEKTFGEKLSGVFIDESNYPIFPSDILEDFEDKAGFQFSDAFRNHVSEYIYDHDIERYLTEEEVLSIVDEIESYDFLLHPDRVKNLVYKMLKDRGLEDAEVYGGNFYIYSDNFYFYLENPKTGSINEYRYSDDDGFTISPFKDKRDESCEFISIKDIPFGSISKVMATSSEFLKDFGIDKPHDFTNDPKCGISFVMTEVLDGELIFRTRVVGKTDATYLEFDRGGTLR